MRWLDDEPFSLLETAPAPVVLWFHGVAGSGSTQKIPLTSAFIVLPERA